MRDLTKLLLGVVAMLGLCLPASLSAGQDRGRPTCDYCRMIISEKEFGGRLQTSRKAKAYIFDATECMAAFLIKGSVPQAQIRSLSSVHHGEPSQWMNAKDAWYVQSATLMSPMSMNLSAHRTLLEAEALRKKHGGDVLSWNQVLELVKSKWFPPMKR